MMSILEYAEDVSKSVEEIVELCKKLGINKTNEDDLLTSSAYSSRLIIKNQPPCLNFT